MGDHLAPQPPKQPEPGHTRHLHPKVEAGSAAGALSILVVWLLSTAGVDIPEPVATAIGAVVTLALSYFMPAAGMKH